MSELDALHNYRVVAEYIPGPAYVDDTVAARRDLNRDGDFGDTNEGFLYYLTDQQYSTVALLDETGAVVERYGYDHFGAPSIYNADATATLSQSAVGNARLYTGRDYLPALGVYHYRQRAYDPATGRFLTTDPIGSFGDPANLGNPYTYVANNPGSFVDPFGEEGWKEYFSTIVADPFQHYILGTLGGDNSEAFARHKARQSALIDPAAAGETFGETGERYAPHVGPQLGQAFDDTLEDASRSGLAGAQFLTGPAGAAANAIAVADDIGQGNWGSAILGGAGAVGSIKSVGGATEGAERVAKESFTPVRGWRVGDPITNLTAKGEVPAWSTVRERFWENEALNNSFKYDAENLARMRRGRAPQQANPRTGIIESKELHHNPPQREGGLFEFEAAWPDEHSSVDAFRRTGRK